MAYTQVQTIADTDRRLVLKRVNSANTETDALVVNAAALGSAVVAITTDASANNFKVGETLTSGSGGTGIVQDVLSDTSVYIINKTGTFADNDTLTGSVTGRVRQQNGNVAPASYALHISNIIYNVHTGGNEAVTLMWEGNGGGANNRVIAVLSGVGTLNFAKAAARIPNNANNATGNITLSTENWNSNAHYSIILDVAKQDGYAAPNLDRNTLGRY